MVAEFDYQPIACKKSYRMIVLRKRLATDQQFPACDFRPENRLVPISSFANSLRIMLS
jgi:hypothetical protein